jgi:hypothetical protein
MSDCICGSINARHCPVHNEGKPREWVVKYGEKSGNIGFVAADGPVPDINETVPVIEYSSYAALKKECEELKDKMEKYDELRRRDRSLIDDIDQENAALRESLKLAVEALECTWPNMFEEIKRHHNEALTRIKTKHGELK